MPPARKQSDLPIVFVGVSDPIGAGFVESFSRPSGRITGFTNFEAAMGGKWVELLHEIAPAVKRVSMLFNPATANTGASGGIYLRSIESAARALGVELLVGALNEPADIENVYSTIAQNAGSGAIVYPHIRSVKAGGLLYYGVSVTDLFRRAASMRTAF
jgi:putative ABC transport system substrate-binding protein